MSGHSNTVGKRSADLVVSKPAVMKDNAAETEAGTKMMTDDELAHAVVQSISDQLNWESKFTVDWYAFALPFNASDNKRVSVQVGG